MELEKTLERKKHIAVRKKCSMDFILVDYEDPMEKMKSQTTNSKTIITHQNGYLQTFSNNAKDESFYPKPKPPETSGPTLHGCGIYAMKFMELWIPRAQLTDHIVPNDIPNIRKQLLWHGSVEGMCSTGKDVDMNLFVVLGEQWGQWEVKCQHRLPMRDISFIPGLLSKS
ncbi:hypothetical protein E2562_035802 [Oryza meyeriana var. granulata]|uniref:Uncharacterized protein n=1 Tax=Oryza meyeriana var. granulata TaxID=110450 RepID=A0A6G1ECH2_9ORYZ|nr:hypothetical protein E2562_035802 [Oryza meyeriana var. granulata]